MTDFRAYLKPRPSTDLKANSGAEGNATTSFESVIGKNINSNVMQPLYDTNGLLFPYTPTIMQFGGTANYNTLSLTHTNYEQPTYTNSTVRDISLTAKFTAQTQYEAKYVLAMLKFMSRITKMTFGERDSTDFYPDTDGYAGLPPPILLFSYLGTHMFNDVPVVATSYSLDLSEEVDYVPVTNKPYPEEVSYVPTELTLNLELKPYYNTKDLRSNFKLSDFASGDMIRGDGSKTAYGKGYL